MATLTQIYGASSASPPEPALAIRCELPRRPLPTPHPGPPRPPRVRRRPPLPTGPSLAPDEMADADEPLTQLADVSSESSDDSADGRHPTAGNGDHGRHPTAGNGADGRLAADDESASDGSRSGSADDEEEAEEEQDEEGDVAMPDRGESPGPEEESPGPEDFADCLSSEEDEQEEAAAQPATAIGAGSSQAKPITIDSADDAVEDSPKVRQHP